MTPPGSRVIYNSKSAVFFEFGNDPHEAVNIVEVLIHRGKSDISHRVDVFQPLQYKLTDLLRCDLALEGIFKLSGDLVHHILYSLQLDRALYGSPAKPVDQLSAVERLNGIILFDNHQGDILDYLIGGEPETALDTLAAAANLVFGGA